MVIWLVVFTGLVKLAELDDALVWMRKQLESNDAVVKYVEAGNAVKA